MNKVSGNPTNGPQGAVQGPPRASVGESEVAARKGVISALRPNSQAGDGRYFVAWLSISTPYGATPTARSTCLCGWDRRAFGARKVLALITEHANHREHCPLRAPQEGRTAA
jgi:hypothetical protein